MTSTASSLVSNIEKVVRGKTACVEATVICLLARGHLLIEDVPGVGKTTLAYSLAKSIHCDFKRIQFTSDMLPSDILGVSIYDTDKGVFRFNKGPIFTNIALADEINRTTPKTQSSLLEVMEQGRISIDGQSLPLPKPFMVVATQNPVDFEGTFPLPRSQMDRFLMRIEMGYPDPQHEMEILRGHRHHYHEMKLDAVITPEEVIAMQEAVENIHVSREIHDYILRIVTRTRDHEFFDIGVSPRGTMALSRAAQARALLHGREFVTPDDVKELCVPVLAHRVVLPSQENQYDAGLVEASRRMRDILSSVHPPA